MASDTARRAPRRPSSPRPGSGKSSGQSKGKKSSKPSVPEVGATPAQEVATSTAQLENDYSHVKRDLTRIAVISVLLFGMIYASTFFVG